MRRDQEPEGDGVARRQGGHLDLRRRPSEGELAGRARLDLGVERQPELDLDHVLEAVAARRRVEQVGDHGGVEGQRGDVDPERQAGSA